MGLEFWTLWVAFTALCIVMIGVLWAISALARRVHALEWRETHGEGEE